ncbi:hypothetical protein E3U23_00085 [Erythrobacter litoralis]|uniref:hypothetical protein n=1 Tax=Erythrobacter litoralis TaxID=39960 RepID=UPI002434D0DB|nr:hypothetical protein [Erythrobacter litoralis]MDG6077595.1 hypothetical protein [Erythrobacter litoralis]
MLRYLAIAGVWILAACKPPASDDYSTRVPVARETQFASEPLPSPNAEGAVWADSPTVENRILYGKPGERPLMGLTCDAGQIVFARYAPADPEAKAILALIGNGHVERLFVDATPRGEAWLWQGSLPANDQRLEVLTGRGRVEATIPGAGSLILNASTLPAQFVDRCAATTSFSPSRPEDPA